ncbi:T-cell immunomodulatory protein-like [Asterias rubens]|uniref:T-cell immunomodulatory protein-like n=1 Tax=Asterias rubens TaxID=7604 RepID=UPI001455CB84|nr:T-cell immunomodulatory protein-like [Asterias rubens]
MSRLSSIFLLLLSLLAIVFCDDPFAVNTAEFTDNTNAVFTDGGPADGIIAAYGDIDSNKLTDVFVLRQDGHIMDVYYQLTDGSDTTLSKSIHNLSIKRDNDTITSVVPGDFDGDSQMDVLLTTKQNGKVFDTTAPTSVFVYWGQTRNFKLDPITTVSTTFQDQPLMMDFDADMIPDLFGEDVDGKRQFWHCNDTTKRTFQSTEIKGDHDPLRIPNSNSFLDMTDNYAPDLIVTSMSKGRGQFEQWELFDQRQSWIQTDLYAIPAGNFKHIGQSAFADMGSKGRLDHLLPVCEDEACTKSYIYIRRGGEKSWSLFYNLQEELLNWGFVPPQVQVAQWANVPITLRIGDTNMDSYPDIMCVLRSGTNSTAVRRVVLLENKEGKTLSPDWDIDALNAIKTPVLATFLDLTRSGVLDIMVVNQTKPDQQPQICVIKNNFVFDAYSVKAHVLSGLCFNDCPELDSKPFGVNQPGPFIYYKTTSSTGKLQCGASTQLSQSAYFSLQLPYIILGLGPNPNYVDSLTVSIAGATKRDTPNTRQHTWMSIIPNSELIAIPYPPDEPEEWTSVLLITPGRSVLLTGGVLIGTCVFMAIVVGVLQLLEKREDDREKRQESHRFHFDAM